MLTARHGICTHEAIRNMGAYSEYAPTKQGVSKKHARAAEVLPICGGVAPGRPFFTLMVADKHW